MLLPPVSAAKGLAARPMTTRGGTRPCLRVPSKSHHRRWVVGPELLGGGLQEGHQDGDHQDGIPQGWLQGAAGGNRAGRRGGHRGGRGHPLRPRIEEIHQASPGGVSGHDGEASTLLAVTASASALSFRLNSFLSRLISRWFWARSLSRFFSSLRVSTVFSLASVAAINGVSIQQVDR